MFVYSAEIRVCLSIDTLYNRIKINFCSTRFFDRFEFNLNELSFVSYFYELFKRWGRTRPRLIVFECFPFSRSTDKGDTRIMWRCAGGIFKVLYGGKYLSKRRQPKGALLPSAYLRFLTQRDDSTLIEFRKRSGQLPVSKLRKRFVWIIIRVYLYFFGYKKWPRGKYNDRFPVYMYVMALRHLKSVRKKPRRAANGRWDVDTLKRAFKHALHSGGGGGEGNRLQIRTRWCIAVRRERFWEFNGISAVFY